MLIFLIFKMELGAIDYKAAVWVELPQDRVQRLAVMNASCCSVSA
jgi:hypothetical protein